MDGVGVNATKPGASDKERKVVDNGEEREACVETDGSMMME